MINESEYAALMVRIRKMTQELETLRAENEALKAENKRISQLVIKTDDLNVGLLMQRRVLVEALRTAEDRITHVMVDDVNAADFEDIITLRDGARFAQFVLDKALCAILDETLELYRLEREFLNKSKEWHFVSTTVNDMPYEDYKNLQEAWQASFLAYTTSEAHKEGK